VLYKIVIGCELTGPRRNLLVKEVYRSDQDPARHKETVRYQTWRDTVAEMMAEPRPSLKYRNIFPDAGGWEYVPGLRSVH
jgi:hypothetical protein